MSVFKTLMMIAAMTVFANVATAQQFPVRFNLSTDGAISSALSGQNGASFSLGGFTLTASAEGPEFSGGVPTGNIIALQTFVNPFPSIFSIDNQTISDDEFEDFTGDDNNEDSFISPGEILTFSFDTDVEVSEINFFQIEDPEEITVTVGGTPFIFTDNGSDEFEDPFGGLLIPADTNITFQISSTDPLAERVRFGLTYIDVMEPGMDCLLGDVDGNGTVDFQDISPFIVVLALGQFQCEADIDENFEVNFLDISPFINILSGA